MKSTWPLLLGLLLLATPEPVQAQLNYTTNGGTVTITGYSGFAPFGTLNIPATINNLPVTGIADYAFNGLDTVTNVTIPASVTNIGVGAFSGCTGLVELTVDPTNSYYSSPNGVLFDKAATMLVEYPGGLGGNYTIPGDVSGIGVAAFEQCYVLTNVTIPGSVTNIGNDAFNDCTALTNITVDATDLFFSSTNGVLFDKNQTTLIAFPGGVGGSYTIPGGVISIESTAFQDCLNLTNITVPDSVTNVGDRAFLGCTGLKSIMVSGQNPVYGSTNGVLFDKAQTALIAYPGGLGGTYTVPGGITLIGAGAFEYCQTLTSVRIPGSVSDIGAGAFENCYNLDSVTMNVGVSTIESNAFENCYSLPSVTIPGSVTNIGDEAFDYCLSLARITIPASVNNIGTEAFAFCSSVTTVTFSGGVSNVGEEAFAYCSSLLTVTIPASVTTVAPYTFYECAALASATISEGVSNIGIGAFEQCYSLAGVTIPGSVTNIGDNAFNDCTSLATIIIPAGVSSIGNNAFVNCAGLTAINVDAQDSLYSSTNGVLFDKSQSTLIEYPGGLPGSYTIPASVTAIAADALENCQGLTNVTIPGNVTNVGVSAFEDCSGLRGVAIQSGVTSIGASAFYGCTSLPAITIPGSVTNIGEYAFEAASFYFTGNAPAVDSSAFDSYNNPAVFYLPGTIGWPAFSAITGLAAALWDPVIQTGDGGFGVQNDHFGFNITGPTNLVVVVEACTNLAGPVWTPLQSVALTNGSFHFSEPLQNNIPGRFYGLGLP